MSASRGAQLLTPKHKKVLRPSRNLLAAQDTIRRREGRGRQVHADADRDEGLQPSFGAPRNSAINELRRASMNRAGEPNELRPRRSGESKSNRKVSV